MGISRVTGKPQIPVEDMQNNAHNQTRQTIPDFSRLARIVDSLFYQPCHAGLAHEQSDVNQPRAAKKPLLRRVGALKNVVEAMFNFSYPMSSPLFLFISQKQLKRKGFFIAILFSG
jgi:hypothetical protein